MTFEEAALLPKSEKITLVTMLAEKRAKLFDSYSGSVYVKDVEYHVDHVKQFGVELEAVNNIPTSPGTYFYSYTEKKIYVWLIGDGNPSSDDVSLVYRFHFSNAPVILPSNLTSGSDVEWLPYIESVGSIGQSLDDENTGIVLESSSSVTLINQGFFDDIFDTLLFENKAVSFYYWFPITPVSEARKVFEGVIESKSFAPDKVVFNVKDFIFRLRDNLNLGTFNDADGSILDTYLGTPKRRIYGRVNKCQCVGIDTVKDGYPLTGLVTVSENINTLTGSASAAYVSNDLAGTIAGTVGTRTITGTGTTFLSQIFPNQKLRVSNGLVTYTFTVQSVASNTSLTVSSNINATFAGFTGKNFSNGNKKVYGLNTKFLEELQNGNSIQFFSGATAYNYTVESIESNTELTLSEYVTTSFSLFGVKNLNIKNNVISGNSTLFLDELSPEDEIIFSVSGTEYKYTIESVASDTVAFITDNVEAPVINQTGYIKPKIGWRKRNRRWHLAGHKLRSSVANIISVVNARQFIVDDVSEFFTDDVVTINGTTTQVTRVSGDQIVLEQNIFPVPVAGNFITKEPVLGVYFGSTKMELSRDFTVSNSTEAIIEINSLAEFNLAKESYSSVSLDFESGSNVVRSRAGFDLTKIIRPRDWIRSFTQSSDAWFEVLFVQKESLILRTNYNQPTNSSPARIKQVEIIGDDALITVDCYGLEFQNKWVRTASNAVRHMVKYDAGFTDINESTFEQADADCKYTLSMVIPDNLGGRDILIRDEITKINESVFGSLYGNTVQQICYSIVNSRRPATIQPIKDDDIISWSSESANEIINQVTAIYGHFTDTVASSSAANYYSFYNEFVNKYTKIKRKVERNIYLYEASNAETIAQRIAFYGSLSRLKVILKSKAIFFNYSVNDRIYIDLDRLYKRYGSGSRLKIGIVSSVKKSSYDSEIVLNDLGNIFNRCPSIAPDDTAVFATASDDDKVKFGFILNNETLLPGSSEDDLGCCLIG